MLDSSEYVRVTVPVCRSTDPGMEVWSRARTSDPCDAPPADIASCTPIAFVRAGQVTTQPNCYLDNQIRGGEVGRVLQCPGSRALVVFDRATFSGELVSGYVNVCKTTSYDFPQGDNCTWRTEQRISGALESADPLSFSYTESPVAGRECTLACRAAAQLTLLD
jgi:hypothetical protein